LRRYTRVDLRKVTVIRFRYLLHEQAAEMLSLPPQPSAKNHLTAGEDALSK